jgi:hypothetical protein
MPTKVRLEIIKGTLLTKGPIVKAWKNALIRLENWLQSQFIQALVYGGMGIQGISQTPFYIWITSPDGLSQLGIPPSEPPKLLDAYLKTFRVDTRGYTISFSFGNVYNLIRATPHPANGTGRLKVGSWLRWAVDGKKVPDRGYVPRSNIPQGRLQKRIRLNNPLGGLMLPGGAFGSTGRWELPLVLRNYADEWFVMNKKTIEDLIAAQMEAALIKELT